MTKYILKGLDCASCANEIENALKKVEWFGSAQVNFATQSIVLDPCMVTQAQAIITRIEPEVKLLATESQAKKEPSKEDRELGHLVRLSASVILLGLGFVFQGFFPETTLAWVPTWTFLIAYVLVGYPVLLSAARSLIQGRMLNEMFLMSLATVVAIVIHQLPEAAGVMLFYSTGEFFQNRVVARSRKSISSLMNLRPEFARIVVAGNRENRPPEAVRVGELVEVLPGARIPLDGEVLEGESFVDTSSLTGE